jgi:hypothetical protein
LERNQIFRLKGLAESVVNIDLEYIFALDRVETGYFTFQGVTGLSKIQLNMTNRSWFVQLNSDYVNKSKILATYMGPKLFPLGTQNWTFLENSSSTALKLSKVISDSFIEITNIF